MSLYSVFDKVMDTKDFTVGGGAASAIAGAMAAGLVGMVARLSIGKDYGLHDERYEAIAGEMDTLCQKLTQGAQDDEEAFLGIKNAFKLPKGTDEEKVIRRAAVENAAVQAATVPMENARRAARILEICAEMENRSNPAAASDITSGVLLARSAVMGCALNIDANLPLIKTPEKSGPLAEAADKLKAKANG